MDEKGLDGGVMTRGLAVVLATLAVMVPPCLATLMTVSAERERVPVEGNPTPYGYTVSLLMFLVPAVVLTVALHRWPGFEQRKRAYRVTLAVLIPQGFLLDVLLAARFFTFENVGATVGLRVPVVGGHVPVEEFLFYGLGFLAMLAGYLWFSEAWLRGVQPPRPKVEGSLLKVGFEPRAILVGVALVAAAWVYKKYGPHPYHEGFPGYFAVLVAAAVVPTVGFAKAVIPRVHWRAFALTGAILLAVSMLWEASLASPYQWWNYQYDQMMGITFAAWCGLPAEAVFLWFAVMWATTFWYEAIVLYLERAER